MVVKTLFAHRITRLRRLLIIRCMANILIVAFILAYQFTGTLSTYGIIESPAFAGTFVRNDKRAVPTLLIIGTAKGGTTDLYYQLTQDAVNSEPSRPDLPLRSLIKEVGFLHVLKTSSANLTLGAAKHRAYHPCASAPSHSLADCMGDPEHYTIDATPSYDFHPTVPELLQGFSPNSKVIMLLRTPTDRNESLYYHWMVEPNEWPNISINRLADEFFDFIDSSHSVSAVLDRLASCRTVQCQADGWREAFALGITRNSAFTLFAAGLYRYILPTWCQHYFKPGRVMVIDSHMYFRNRGMVMEQVIAFLYGRSMTAAERNHARTADAQNVKHRHNATSSVKVISRSLWMLSPGNRIRLDAFYNKHVLQGLYHMLEGMRSEGAWIVGFQSLPWPCAKCSLAQTRIRT